MEIEIFASSSRGNCSLVSADGIYILIDCGISARRISGFLARRGLAPSDLAAILITHEHTDHVAGLYQLTKRQPIPIYASCGTAEAICDTLPQVAGMLEDFRSGESFSLAGLEIATAATPHDACDSVCYRISSGRETIGYATDLGHMPDAVFKLLSGAGTVVLESNHDIDMLKTGPYPPYLKSRILGPRGHLSNELAAETVGRLISCGARNISLAHLSQENNTPDRARKAAMRVICDMGMEREVTLKVAPVLEEM